MKCCLSRGCRMFCQATGFGGTVQQGQTVEEKLRERRAISQACPRHAEKHADCQGQSRLPHDWHARTCASSDGHAVNQDVEALV